MNFEEFLERIFHMTDISIPKYQNWKDLKVVVTTSDHSIGGRAFSEVKAVCRGFDWEHNQIRIETVDKLYKKKEKKEDDARC